MPSPELILLDAKEFYGLPRNVILLLLNEPGSHGLQRTVLITRFTRISNSAATMRCTGHRFRLASFGPRPYFLQRPDSRSAGVIKTQFGGNLGRGELRLQFLCAAVFGTTLGT